MFCLSCLTVHLMPGGNVGSLKMACGEHVQHLLFYCWTGSGAIFQSVTELFLACRLNELPVAVGQKGQPNIDNNIPWRGMFTALPIWAIVLNNFTFHYAVYVVLNWLPTYFHSLLQQDLADLGAVKTIPFLLMFVTSNVGGWAGDWLIMKGASRRAGRVIVNTAGRMSEGMRFYPKRHGDHLKGCFYQLACAYFSTSCSRSSGVNQ